MHRYNCSWFIIIIISTKTWITCEFLQGGDPSFVTSFIVTPTKYIYETSKAVPTVYQKVKNFLVSPADTLWGQSTRFVEQRVTNPPGPLDVSNKAPSTIIPTGHNYFTDKQKKLQSSTPIANTNNYVTRSFVTNWGVPIHHTVHLTTPHRSTNNVLYYRINNEASTPIASTYDLSTSYMNEDPYVSKVDAAVDFKKAMDQLEHKFYEANFRKFLSISPPQRQENGISFAQSGLFLYLQLVTLCSESDEEVTTQIRQLLGLNTSCEEQIQVLKHVISILPKSSEFLKFRWSSRLVLGERLNISEIFLKNIAPELQIHLDRINNTDSPEELTIQLNNMVAKDSGGAMYNTFEEDELSNGICAVWLTTLYFRARWRSAPTVLDGSRPFYDGDAPRTVRMIRINDEMRYARLDEWDAEAIEIRYATADLTLLLLVPRGRSLKNLAEKVMKENLQSVYEKMYAKRVAVTLPIYTLRMTLLLPGKLESMGISQLIQAKTDTNCNKLKLSHAVQRIMFWAEAGRNAFKDDGIEWDEVPQLEIVVDHPYVFFVRWRNLTLLNGNFVL